MKKIPDDLSNLNDESENLLEDNLSIPNISILNEDENRKSVIKEEIKEEVKRRSFQEESPSKSSSKPDYVSRFIPGLSKEEYSNLLKLESSF